MPGVAQASRSIPDLGLRRRTLAVALAAVALPASLLALPAAPGYDARTWLLWGREVGSLALSTAEGPAFKPLPVAVCALLAPLGDLAPAAWLLLARAGLLLAVVLAWRLAARLAGGSVAAGAAAAAGVALAGGAIEDAAGGGAEGWAMALALLAAERALAGRPRAALAAGAALGLLRPEAWPFLAAAALLRARRAPGERPALALAALALPALWLVPDWLGSGELLRSAERARVPNPGQPALAAVPALAALREAAATTLAPLGALGLAAALAAAWRRAARGAAALALAGLAWILLVAAMSQGGFSGEARYALPGVALLTVAGAVTLAALPRRAALAGLLLVALLALPRLAALPAQRDALAWSAGLDRDLAAAVAAAGGRQAVLACGTPVTGPYRGPLLAWHLRVPKARIAFAARAPGVVFRSRLRPERAPEPAVPAGFAPLARAGRWDVHAAC